MKIKSILKFYNDLFMGKVKNMVPMTDITNSIFESYLTYLH